jgi:cytochrome c-type biogenesis protein CcmH
MSLTLLGPLFVVTSIAVLLLLLLRSRGSRREQLDLEACRAGLEDIGTRLKLGKLNEAEADAARLALLSRLQASNSRFGRGIRSTPQTWVVAAVVFLLVSGMGAVVSYPEKPSDATRLEEATSASGADAEALAQLADYARSIGSEPRSSMTTTGELLPDVDSMIDGLAARLETAPQDIEGWRMLGWSYFHTARYEQAATAFGRALELDPSSAELRLSYDEAKAKASESGSLKIASSLQTGTVDKSGEGPSAEDVSRLEAMTPSDRDAAIRSMVDGLAHRLESSPRDAEGWIRLMRSRIVLGERGAAETAFHKALEVFKNDAAASGKITAAAIELGLARER